VSVTDDDSAAHGDAGPADDRVTEPFRFAYDPPAIRCGQAVASALDEELAAQGFESALVVCGRTVGSTTEVIDPVTEGLGERLAGVFAETTPEKRLKTAHDAVEKFRETGADVLVGLGGGSSLDVAKVASVLEASDRPAAAAGAQLQSTGTIEVPETGVAPIVAVPTTLAGADLSQMAGVTATPDSGLVEEPTSGGISHPNLMPAAVVADSALVATTPEDVLAASAMNGFDKGIETLYAADATPVTDATAVRGLSLFQEGLLAFGEGSRADWVYDSLVRGVVLVQFGISRPEGTTLSLVHAFGHGLTRTYPVQQGAAHAVVAPHVLELLFDRVDGRRRLLADALGVAHDSPASGVVDAVEAVRTSLDLPTRLSDVDGPTPEEFPAVAEDVLADAFIANGPRELTLTVEDVERVLEAAW
jgi:alcohol dehydrogenase class IV